MLYIYAVGKKKEEHNEFISYYLRKTDAILELDERKKNGEDGLFVLPIELKESIIVETE